MKSLTATCAALAIGIGLAMPASAQEDMGETEDLDRAAGDMIATMYVYEPIEYRRPSQVIARLRELGYTDIEDFDVEWGAYEVEATSADGDEVEIEIDPLTGAIIDIDEDWF